MGYSKHERIGAHITLEGDTHTTEHVLVPHIESAVQAKCDRLDATRDDVPDAPEGAPQQFTSWREFMEFSSRH